MTKPEFSFIPYRTWSHRVDEYDIFVAKALPEVNKLPVVTSASLVFTHACNLYIWGLGNAFSSSVVGLSEGPCNRDDFLVCVNPDVTLAVHTRLAVPETKPSWGDTAWAEAYLSATDELEQLSHSFSPQPTFADQDAILYANSNLATRTWLWEAKQGYEDSHLDHVFFTVMDEITSKSAKLGSLVYEDEAFRLVRTGHLDAKSCIDYGRGIGILKVKRQATREEESGLADEAIKAWNNFLQRPVYAFEITKDEPGNITRSILYTSTYKFSSHQEAFQDALQRINGV